MFVKNNNEIAHFIMRAKMPKIMNAKQSLYSYVFVTHKFECNISVLKIEFARKRDIGRPTAQFKENNDTWIVCRSKWIPCAVHEYIISTYLSIKFVALPSIEVYHLLASVSIQRQLFTYSYVCASITNGFWPNRCVLPLPLFLVFGGTWETEPKIRHTAMPSLYIFFKPFITKICTTFLDEPSELKWKIC